MSLNYRCIILFTVSLVKAEVFAPRIARSVLRSWYAFSPLSQRAKVCTDWANLLDVVPFVTYIIRLDTTGCYTAKTVVRTCCAATRVPDGHDLMKQNVLGGSSHLTLNPGNSEIRLEWTAQSGHESSQTLGEAFSNPDLGT